MALFNNPLPGGANGNITVMSFVKPDATIYNGYIQAGLNDRACGISQEGIKYAPGLAATIGGTQLNYCAQAGDEFEIFNLGDVCLLTAGTGGGWTNGDDLKSDAQGNGLTTTTPNDNVCARALSTVATGCQGMVQVVYRKY